MTEKLKNSLPISLNLKSVNPLPENIQKYFKLCKEKLGLIPNVLKDSVQSRGEIKIFNYFKNEYELTKDWIILHS